MQATIANAKNRKILSCIIMIVGFVITKVAYDLSQYDELIQCILFAVGVAFSVLGGCISIVLSKNEWRTNLSIERSLLWAQICKKIMYVGMLIIMITFVDWYICI